MAVICIKEHLRQKLSSHRKKRIVGRDLIEAAVLIPIFRKREEYNILFTKRSDKVAYHKNQISFPGGVRGEDDRCLLDTALREACEEIGLEIRDVEILGELDNAITTTGFVISPFVAFIPCPYHFVGNRDEVEEIIQIPIPALMEKSKFRQEYQLINGKIRPAYFYEYDGQVIWGATAWIIKQLLEFLEPSSEAL